MSVDWGYQKPNISFVNGFPGTRHVIEQMSRQLEELSRVIRNQGQALAVVATAAAPLFTELPSPYDYPPGFIIRVRTASNKKTTFYGLGETSTNGVFEWRPFLIVP